MLAGDWAAGLGELFAQASRPSAKRRGETIGDLLLKINFPMEQKECQGSGTKDMHLNHERHS